MRKYWISIVSFILSFVLLWAFFIVKYKCGIDVNHWAYFPFWLTVIFSCFSLFAVSLVSVISIYIEETEKED